VLLIVGSISRAAAGRIFLYAVFAPFVSGRSPVLLGVATKALPEIT